MKILLVEDDKKIASFIIKGLIENGLQVEHVIDGEEGLSHALKYSFNLMIIDIMLPKRDGLSLIEILRKQNITTPILILSAKRSVEEKVNGFQAGSDDYLTKPFAFSELLARVRALLRRGTVLPQQNILTVKSLILDKQAYKVTRDGDEVELKPKEFVILEYLMRNVNQVVTRTMLLENVWNFQFDPGTNIVDVHMCKLREKIDKDYKNKMIQTIRGVGYVLKD